MNNTPIIAKYYVRFHDKPEVKTRMKKEASLPKLLTQAKRAALKLEKDLKDAQETNHRLTTKIAELNEARVTTPKEPDEKPAYPIPNPLALDIKDVTTALKNMRPVDLT